MAIIHDSRGREIRLGDWGGGCLLSGAEGEFAEEEVQGKVVGFDKDDNGWWVVLCAGKAFPERRIRATDVRTVAACPRPTRGPARRGWRRF